MTTIDRTHLQNARKAGLEARHRSRAVGCRYVDPNNGICGNEAVDQTASLLLCQRHLALALEMLLPRLQELGVVH